MKNIKNITQLAIKDLKSEADLKTDYALAKALNVSQSSIARYSNGMTSITLEKLESKFLEYDLVESIDNTIKRNAEIAKIREVEVDNFIKAELANQLPKTISMNIKELLKETKIHRIQNRFNEALLLLSQSSKSISRSWTSQRVDYINDKSNKKAVLKNVLTQGSIVPKFKLVFSDKLKKVLTQEQIMNLTIESFIDLKLVKPHMFRQ